MKKSWPLLLVSTLSVVLVVNGVLTASLYDSAQPAAVTDTTYHKTLSTLPLIKGRPVQPVAVAVSITPDTVKRKRAEQKPIITRFRATPLRKDRTLLQVAYIDPAGAEKLVTTELALGTIEVRGDTIAPVQQDRGSRRREWWRKFWRTTGNVGKVTLAAGTGYAAGRAIEKLSD